MKLLCSTLRVSCVLAGCLFIQLAFADPLPNAWQVSDDTNNASVFYCRTNSASVSQAATNLTGGWSFTVNARFVAGSGPANQTMLIIYGDGVKRWEILWSRSNIGDLQSYLYDAGGTFTVTAGGTGTNLYHTHQIIYNPTNKTASYIVDGQVKTTGWTGNTTAWPAGKIAWGSGSSASTGTMNFHSVSFVVTNGVVASYDAGYSPAGVTNPIANGWFLSISPPPAGTSTNAITADAGPPPTATTLPAGEFSTNSAVLNGWANPIGSPTVAWFEWGGSTNYGNRTPTQNVGAVAYPVSVSSTISPLTFGLDYHFRLVVSNLFGIAYGGDQSFHFQNPLFYPLAIAGLPRLSDGSGAWGDYDNDGNLDLLLTGDGDNGALSQIWHNNGNGTFSNVTATAAPGLPATDYPLVAWGDYDNDGRLDFLITGDSYDTNGNFTVISEIWHQNGIGTFSNVTPTAAPALQGVEYGSVAWGDYNNDGRLDFLITGYGYDTNGFSYTAISQIWRNNGDGTFSDVTTVAAPDLPRVEYGSVAWSDYENDGHLDILITGDEYDADGNFIGLVSEIWRNKGDGTFANVTPTVAPGLTPVESSSVAWADYDNDGRLDFLLTGLSSTGSVSQVWRNTGSGFTNVTASVAPGLQGITGNSVAWGDYDNDGRLDFVIKGYDATNDLLQLWRNTGSGFTNVPTTLPQIFSGFMAWGDYDNDGRLDLLLAGYDSASSRNVPALWKNNLLASNTPPAAPGGLSASVSLTGPYVALSWSAASDAQTPAAGLTYNVRIGTTPGASDVMSAMSLSNGHRLVPSDGNAQHNATTLFAPTRLGQTYYWSVQAVDTTFAGSPFSSEQHFALSLTSATNGIAGDANGDGVVDQGELNTVLNNYWQTSPPNIQSVNTPSNTVFRFNLENLSSLNFHVLASTNVALPLINWSDIGTSTLQYQFADPGATNYPQRFYQLVWP